MMILCRSLLSSFFTVRELLVSAGAGAKGVRGTGVECSGDLIGNQGSAVEPTSVGFEQTAS